MDEPLVSVIIPTLNSERTLHRCLTSIMNQTYKNIEVILVDGGSKDTTLEIAVDFDITIIRLNIPNMTQQTNSGVAESKGQYIYRLDSDVELSSPLIEECIRKCEVDRFDAVATYWGPDGSISFWAAVRKFEKDCYKHDLKRNVARFYKRDAYEKIGGYSKEIVAGEDYDIQNRLIMNGYKVGIVEAEGLHLGEPTSIIQIIKKNYFYGKTLFTFFSVNTITGFKQMSPARYSIIKEWQKFLKNPILSLGFICYELVVYSSALTGLFVNCASRLKNKLYVSHK